MDMKKTKRKALKQAAKKRLIWLHIKRFRGRKHLSKQKKKRRCFLDSYVATRRGHPNL